MNEFLRLPRKVVLWAIALLTAAATAASLGESYHALYLWAVHHQFGGNWGFVWPLQIDTFIAIGEAALFVGLVDMWQGKRRVFPWAVAISGLAVSVAANVGHVSGDLVSTRLTAAVPPIAAWASLVVGMGVLKRVVDLYDKQEKQEKTSEWTANLMEGGTSGTDFAALGQQGGPAIGRPPRQAVQPIEEVHAAAEERFGEQARAGNVPGYQEIRTELGVGQTRAKQVREHLTTLGASEAEIGIAELVADTDEKLGTTEQIVEAPGKESSVTDTFQHPSSYQALPLTPVKH